MLSATIAGAEYGMTLVWALAAGVLMKFAITEGVARWQLATDLTMVEGWRDHLPRAAVVAFFVYFVIWSYVVAGALVSASALVPAALFPAVPLPVWGLAQALAALTMVYFGRYQQILAVTKWLIGLMFSAVLLSTLLIIFRSGANWGALASREPFSVAYTLSLVGGVGGTVTLLSYGYWMREESWAGPERLPAARGDLTISFAITFLFSFAMIFLSSQIEWTGKILDQGPRLAFLLADRIGAETGAVGRTLFLAGFYGAATSSVLGVWHGVPFLFDDWVHTWRHKQPTGQRGVAYRSWAVFLTVASITALLFQPVGLVFAYTVVGSMFFPFVITTLLWMNNSTLMPAGLRNRTTANVVLGGALLFYVYLGVRSIW